MFEWMPSLDAEGFSAMDAGHAQDGDLADYWESVVLGLTVEPEADESEDWDA
jgi:hypothetical protein